MLSGSHRLVPTDRPSARAGIGSELFTSISTSIAARRQSEGKEGAGGDGKPAPRRPSSPPPTPDARAALDAQVSRAAPLPRGFQAPRARATPAGAGSRRARKTRSTSALTHLPQGTEDHGLALWCRKCPSHARLLDHISQNPRAEGGLPFLPSGAEVALTTRRSWTTLPRILRKGALTLSCHLFFFLNV